jgi:hypothetical protein
MKEYNYSSEKAAKALELLTEDQIGKLKEKYSIGGK